MGPPDLLHLLHGQLLRLRQEEIHEERHDAHPSAEEEEGPELEMAQHRQEGLADEERHEEDDGDDDALPRRPDLQRADLGGHQVRERAPGPGEARDEDAHDDQDQVRVLLVHPSVVLELGRQHRPHHHLRQDHLDAAHQQELPPPEPVHHHHGHHVGGRRADARHHRRHERRALLEPDGPEHDRRVEVDDVDARHLVEEGNQQRYHQLRPVLAPQYVPERPPGCRRPRRLASRGHQIVELFLDPGRATQPLQQQPCLVDVAAPAAALDYEAGRLGQEDRADGQERGRHGGQGQRQPPAPSTGDLLHAVVDEVRDEDADADAELKAIVDCPTVLRWRHL